MIYPVGPFGALVALFVSHSIASPHIHVDIILADDTSAFKHPQTVTPHDKDDITYHDCSGKEDGNYMHPYDCHQFITCHNHRAAERECAVCYVDEETCPDGQLYYNAPTE